MKMFVCMPIVIGNGSKYIATNLSHYTKILYPTKKVALVDFDFKNPYLAERLSLHDTIHSIDNLIDKIDGNFLNETLFFENMIKLKNGVDLLKGTKITHNVKLIQKNHIEKIISILKNNYDYVFITVSNEVLAGTVYGLFEATDVVLVARNNYTNFKEFKKVLKIVNNYRAKDSKVHLILNQFSETSEVTFNELFNGTKIENIELVPYNEETFDNNDLDKSKITGKVFKSRNTSQKLFQNILEKLL